MKKIDEKNVEYLFQWSEAVHNDTYNMAIMIVDVLDENQCEMLFEGVPFEARGELIQLEIECVMWRSYLGVKQITIL